MIDWEATILSQYANSPSIVQLIRNMSAYLDPRADIDAFYSMIWNVDTAQGYGLDVWGRIVGVGRVLTVSAGDYFGFSGVSGPSGDPFNVGVFYSGGAITSNYSLTDDAFRVLILAKALANISDATIPAINQILINLFGADGPLPISGNAYVTDGEDMTMTYTFSGSMTDLELAIVTNSGVLPKPAGVSFTVIHP